MPENKAKDWPSYAPKLHHTTFTTLRMDEMVKWYGLVCGLRPLFQSDEASWLTNDEANHRIAFLSPPGLKHPTDKGHETGLHHTAFEFATFDQWLNNYIRLRDHGIMPFLMLDHGITMSVYYQDPDGNGVEIQVDGFGDWADSSEWIANSQDFAENPIGTWFDPEKLVKAREDGLSFKEIHERARAGEYEPAEIPEDIFLPELLWHGDTVISWPRPNQLEHSKGNHAHCQPLPPSRPGVGRSGARRRSCERGPFLVGSCVRFRTLGGISRVGERN